MWCTRWFLPLMLLPVPTTRPYFLTLYILSALFHAKPCAYCILILVGLFATSCYWNPVLTSEFSQSTLSTLNETEQASLWQLKSVQMLSRCWCDFQNTPFFGYTNVTEWERDSIKAAIAAANITLSKPETEAVEDVELVQEKEQDRKANKPSAHLWSRSLTPTWLKPSFRGDWMRTWVDRLQGLQDPIPEGSADETNGAQIHEVNKEQSAQAGSSHKRRWLRSKYDLRPYGIDLILDFGWRR